MKYILGACLVYSLGWNGLQYWGRQLVDDRYKESNSHRIELIEQNNRLNEENSRMKHELLNDTDALQELLRRLDERDKREGVIQRNNPPIDPPRVFVRGQGWKSFPIIPCDCGCGKSPCLCPECYCDDALLESK